MPIQREHAAAGTDGPVMRDDHRAPSRGRVRSSDSKSYQMQIWRNREIISVERGIYHDNPSSSLTVGVD
jgi:hypothetical protein